MSEVKKSTIKFKSADGINEVAGFYYDCINVKPKYILQISHGMCEFIARYDDFAEFMAQNGFAVCGNDHLGHGETSDGENGVDGYFGEKDGHKFILQDLHRMNSLAVKRYPGLPVIMLGHSMGSFLARLYAATYPETLQGLIISGTGGPNPLGGVGLFLTNVIGKIKGSKYQSKLIHNMAFGAYLKRIENPNTQYDWITRDTDIVDWYSKNPKCTFMFSVSAFHELMATLAAVSTKNWAEKVNKNMPVYIFSGEADPVGDYGKGVQKVYELLHDAGVKDLEMKLYPEGRHEMLNEINRKEVYSDVLAWCTAHIQAKQ